MNFLEFCNYKFKDTDEKQKIVNNLANCYKKIKGRSCFRTSLEPGQSSSFVISLLNEFYKTKDQSFDSYLEVGVFFGGSLCALYDSGFTGDAYGLDIYQGYYGNFDTIGFGQRFPSAIKTSDEHMRIVSENCAIFGGSPTLIKANTQEENFDLITEGRIKNVNVLYIDGDHSYMGAISDYNKLIKYLNSDGILLVDNYEVGGVKQAVEEIRTHTDIEELGVWGGTTWIGIKR